ncbi:MAG: glutathione S-transferase [Martelella sp.]|uniref:glutathione binding-like protein n=1 Tax=unclassified Martelella TaxID=2629616 RepID=UPI000C5DF707|nr:glutathione binding-like protein [Martelella sp.]MAU20977.1 glutathione S-transferase [Martelella sp.]|tara:strand:+ start:1976 stop:2692 length:717 start_codon:yes stop_codon:yes gene_type:complete
MSRLSEFPITQRWPAENPDFIQLYSLPTPNGVKVSIALEEMELPYEAHRVAFDRDDQMTPEFLSLNPNNKIPAIIDPEGPEGKPIGLFESGAILIYLAEKTGRLMPNDPVGRYEVIQWVMFQMGGVGPMFGQFGHFFKHAADKVANNPYPVQRYTNESRRLLGVLEGRLRDRKFIMGEEPSDYSIADIAIFPWVRGLSVHYEAQDALKLADFPAVSAWVERCADRPASVKGFTVPAAG